MTTEAPTVETPEAPTSEPGSFESFLQQRRRELQQERKITLPVTGFGGRLVGEYVAPDFHTLKSIGSRYQNLGSTSIVGDEDDLNAAADILIATCQRLYGKAEDGAEVELPRWGADLAERFGIDTSLPGGKRMTSRQAVREIFKGAELKLTKHSGDVSEAVMESEPEVDEALADF